MRDKGIPEPGPERAPFGMDGGFGGGSFGGGAGGAGPFGGAGGVRGAMGGSFDHGDPFTTNLYVGNLSQEVGWGGRGGGEGRGVRSHGVMAGGWAALKEAAGTSKLRGGVSRAIQRAAHRFLLPLVKHA